MSEKERTFPLLLSSVMKSNNSIGSNQTNSKLSKNKSAALQTATQNVIKHASVNLLSNHQKNTLARLTHNFG